MDLNITKGEPIVFGIGPEVDYDEALSYFRGDSSVCVVYIVSGETGIFDLCNELKESESDKYIFILTPHDEKIMLNLHNMIDNVHLLILAGDAPRPKTALNTIVSRYTDLGHAIHNIVGWDHSELFAAKRAKEVAVAIANYVNKLPGHDDVELPMIDHTGRVITRTKNPILPLSTVQERKQVTEDLGISMRELEHIAFCNTNYIVLSREDAENIADLLTDEVDREGGDDVWAFGDKGISYERLIDRLDGLLYPMYPAFEAKNKADSDDTDDDDELLP